MAKKKRNKGGPPSTAAAPADISGRRSRRVLILSIAFLCLLCLIQFWGILSGGMNFWEDAVEGEFPARVFARLALFRGEFPHWNPFTFGGMPFFSTGAGILYPFYLIQSLLPVGGAVTWRVLEAVIVLHVLIAGVNMLVYLRFRGRSSAASLFGATAFMLGGYIITHVIHPGIMFITAWLPLMVLLLERGVREIKPAYAVMGGLLLGCVMQMGHAQVMFYTVIFLLTYALFLSCLYGLNGLTKSTASSVSATPVSATSKSVLTPYEPVLRRVALSALYFIIAAGLCMAQYLPIFEASGHTVRSKFTIIDASEGSLQFVQLLTALLPKLFGAYTGGDESVPRFWLTDAFRHGYYNYWESCFYFGVSTLILAVPFFRKIKTDRTLMFAAAWILSAFLVALGGNFFFYKLLFSLGIPGFNSFRATPRILFVWAFIFPVMAAAVLDGLNDIKASNKLRIILISLCAAAAILGLIAAFGGLKPVFPLINVTDGGADRARYASTQGMLLLINALLLGAVLILFLKNIVNEKWAKILMVACVSIDMLLFAAGQHITRREGADVVFNRAQGMVEAIKNMGKEEIFRVNTRQYAVEPGTKLGNNTGFMMMPRNQGYVSAVEIMEGYNQFRLKNAVLPLDAEKFNVMLDLMNIRHYVNPRLKEGDRDIMLRNETCLPRAKLFYKAAVVGADGINNDGAVDSAIIDYMNGPNYDHHNEVVVADPALAKFTGGNGTGEVKIVKYDFNRIELDVDTDKEAILWLSEIWYPAWKAAVNGNKTKVHRANYGFRAITVPAGKSKAVFKFDSFMFNAGAIISLLTLLLSLTYLGFIFVKKKKAV
ncbi:MAG: YfhO family protein [Chitinispirillales bacterium]|nr:YfhO family protein [Chitinispirillales bacterium]